MKLWLAALLFLSPAPALAAITANQPPLVLTPSSPWNMHYDDDSCLLRRTFGEGEQKIQLDLRRFAPGGRVQATMIAEAMQLSPRGPSYKLEPISDWLSVGSAVYPVFEGDHDGIIFEITVPDNAPLPPDVARKLTGMTDPQARVRLGTTLSLRNAYDHTVELQSGSLQKPFEAMDACLSDLVRLWGLDPEVQAKLSSQAKPRNLRWIVESIRFPSQPLLRGTEGIVNLRLLVDAKGRPTECRVQINVSDPSFEKESCDTLMGTGKFDPALDAAGKPVESYYVTRIIYKV